MKLFSMADSLDGVPHLLGSIHTFTPGYGYGARVPTVRNQQTLPASIPKYRYAPVSQKDINMCKTVEIDMSGPKSIKRHQDQMTLQTSGEYGRFMYPKFNNNNTSEINSTMQLSSRPHTTSGVGTGTYNSSRKGSGSVVQQTQSGKNINNSSNNNSTSRSGSDANNSNISSYRSNISSNTGSEVMKMKNTAGSIQYDYKTICKYRKKDPIQDSFMRYTKYDSIACNAPPRDKSDISWCSIGNHMAAEHSHAWAIGLRPYKKPGSTIGTSSTSSLGETTKQ